MNDETVNVRYMVDDVDTAIAFYTSHLGFSLITSAAPAFADVRRGAQPAARADPASAGDGHEATYPAFVRTADEIEDRVALLLADLTTTPV